jgi:hypothetical protein
LSSEQTRKLSAHCHATTILHGKAIETSLDQRVFAHTYTRTHNTHTHSLTQMSETFEKLPFDEKKFLRCARESAAFPITEVPEDRKQTSFAANGVNAQCLHCLSRGCGYCFVSNILTGDEKLERAYPGEALLPKVQISKISQCFYDSSPSGMLCEKRLETNSCLHRRPLYIDRYAYINMHNQRLKGRNKGRYRLNGRLTGKHTLTSLCARCAQRVRMLSG